MLTDLIFPCNETFHIPVLGKEKKGNVHIVDGVVGACTVTSSGSGYTKGDVLGIATIGNNNVGRNARLSIVSIGQTSELILDNVQGDFALN